MSDRQDLVSVIIPTYNRAARCKSAVESVLSQTHTNVEVIVVDDGSKDNTGEVINGLDDRVKYIYQANAGVSAARNTGLKAATGDYIAFLDSDDLWLPRKLEAQLSVFRAFPDTGMVWTDMKAIDENDATLHESYLKHMYAAYDHFDRERDFAVIRPLSEVWEDCPAEYLQRKCYEGNIFSWMFMGNLVHTSTVLLRLERQKKVGLFDVDLVKSGEDYDFHFRTCHEGDVAYLDIPSILYRVGAADQLTEKKYMIWVARNNLKTIMKMLAVAKNEIHLPRRMIRKRLANAHAWVGLEEFSEDHAKARYHITRSLLLSPFRLRLIEYLCLSFLSNNEANKIRKLVHKNKYRE